MDCPSVRVEGCKERSVEGCLNRFFVLRSFCYSVVLDVLGLRGVLDVGRRGDGCVYYEYLVYYCCIPYTTITTTTHRSDEDNLCLVHDSSAGLSVERLTLILDCTHVYRSKDN